MVVSLHDITVGDDIEFKRVLASAGFDGDMVKALLRKPQLADSWVANLREQLAPPAPTFDQLFCTPEQIFDAFVVRARDRKWTFSDEQLQQLREAMPTLHKNSLTSVLTLDIWLGDLPTTFEELWSWNKDVHAKTWRYDGLKSDKRHLRLLDSKCYGNQPSAKWVVLDVTANRGQAPKDVREPANSPAFAVLAAAVLHPEWPKAINYDTIPGVWLPGLEATVPGWDAWRYVPILHWYEFDHGLDLRAYWDDYRYSDYAVPVFREL
jgi:hypothetical protein